MKVNTDGVLLGAWQDVSTAENILDIGTGSGVLALIMAQKNNKAIIDAVEIDENAFVQTSENFEKSPWRGRLTAVNGAIQDYRPDKRYDLIISNPPYFIEDLKSPDNQKNVARHSLALNYEDLLNCINRLLTNEGRALICLPAFNFSGFESLAKVRQLHATHITEVTAVTGREPYLVLILLERTEKDLVKDSIIIQNSTGEFTGQYKEMTRDFYLNF